MKNQKVRSSFSWIWEFAGKHKSVYGLSVFFAILGVTCSILPYFLIADIVKNLLDGYKNIDLYAKKSLIIILL